MLIDSTDITLRGEGERHSRKHGGAHRWAWRKTDPAVDEATSEVWLSEFTTSDVGDAAAQLGLLRPLYVAAAIGFVAVDGPAGTRGCRDAIADRGAHAIVPLRHDAKPEKHDSAGVDLRQGARPCAPKGS